MSAPERIYLDGDAKAGDGYFTRCFETAKPCSEPAIEYVRADLCDPTQDERVRALEAENARLRNELGNAASHVGGALDALTSGPFDASDPRIEAISQYADLIRAALRALEGGGG